MENQNIVFTASGWKGYTQKEIQYLAAQAGAEIVEIDAKPGEDSLGFGIRVNSCTYQTVLPQYSPAELTAIIRVREGHEAEAEAAKATYRDHPHRVISDPLDGSAFPCTVDLIGPSGEAYEGVSYFQNGSVVSTGWESCPPLMQQ